MLDVPEGKFRSGSETSNSLRTMSVSAPLTLVRKIARKAEPRAADIYEDDALIHLALAEALAAAGRNDDAAGRSRQRAIGC